MNRITIDDVYRHCLRQIDRYGNHDSLFYQEHKLVKEVIEQLKEYQNLEEQGLLLRLPCPIGAEVWEIGNQLFIDSNGCKDCVCYYDSGIECFCDCDEDVPACTKIVSKKFTIRMLNDFGKTVFRTKEEAEAKLKEMRGGQNGN